MSRVQVVSDDGRTVVDIAEEDRDGEPWTIAVCSVCGQIDDDRGNFEDTVQQAQIHVDLQH